MTHWEDVKPGFKWSVAVTKPIAVSAEKVWQIISTPGNLELCHPFCARNPVQVWPGENALDRVHYLSGWVYERRFCRWIDGIGYDLEIGRRGGRLSFVSWRISSVDSQRSSLRIAVYPHAIQQIPVVLRWIPHHLRLGPMLKQYLSSVTRGFEWYLTRGEPVPRNQFGANPWFSASRTSGEPSLQSDGANRSVEFPD